MTKSRTTICIAKSRSDDTAPRVGISQCLLGDAVRFDGGHKRDSFLTDVLGSHVEWVSVCPEVEAGLGIPREPIRLISSTSSPRVMTVKTSIDHTVTMERFSEQRVRELTALNLSGYVFKKDSPSCGMERVRVYNAHGRPVRSGVGVFAQAFMAHFPLVPVEDEGRLNDPSIRDTFIERMFCYRRWQDLLSSDRLTRGELMRFHTHHKLLLLAHSRQHHDALGQLVAHANKYRPAELALRYGAQFMNALKTPATLRKHVNVLQHVMSYFKTVLDKRRRKSCLE
jgi:uncharacterized protein YbbK (DUF523 family)